MSRPGLSKGEMEVARQLWQLRKATVREVHEALQQTRDIDFATVQTYLRRLAAKGYVRAQPHGRAHVYSPVIQPRTVIRDTVKDLIDRLFGGNPLPLMRHLIEDGSLNRDELDELRRLLDEWEQT